MKLPGFNKKPTQPEAEITYHYALRISPAYVQGAVWVKEDDTYQILSLSSSWEWTSGSLDSLINQADQALGECSAAVNEDIGETDSVLLGIPVSWTSNGQLLSEYKQVLKELTHKLDLTPLGFVVTTESIVNFLNTTQGVVNGIVIGIESQTIELAMVGQGIIHQLTVYDHHSALVEDITAAIHSLNNPHLPPKVILYSGESELTPLQRQLIEYDWIAAQIGFMHIPEIAVVPNNSAIEAVINSMVPQNAEQVANQAIAPPIDELPAETNQELLADDEIEEDFQTQGTPVTPAHLAAVGFIADEHITQVNTSGQQLLEDNPDPDPIEEVEPDDEIEDEPIPDEQPKERKTASIPKSRKFKPKFPWKTSLVIILIVGILVGVSYWLMTTTTATLTLYLNPQVLEKQFTVTVDPEAESSQIDQGIIKGNVVTTTLSGSSTAAATGSDTIGDKATGSITLYNDSEAARTLKAGTVITAVDKELDFTLSEDVQIASKSVDLTQNPPFSPGTATASVTAAKIGPDYNLPAQTAFKVGNFTTSTILARNEAAFAGGTSREVKVVAKDDLTIAENQLVDELEGQAQSSLQAEVPPGQTLIEGSTFQEWQEQSFSHKVGEESDSVTIEGKLEIGAIVYDQTELNSFAQSNLIDQVPSDKVLSDNIDVSFQLIDQTDDGVYEFKVTTKSQLIPKLTRDKIAKKIAGKSPRTVADYLNSLPAVEDHTVEISPQLPGWFYRFPFEPEKITVDIQ